MAFSTIGNTNLVVQLVCSTSFLGNVKEEGELPCCYWLPLAPWSSNIWQQENQSFPIVPQSHFPHSSGSLYLGCQNFKRRQESCLGRNHNKASNCPVRLRYSEGQENCGEREVEGKLFFNCQSPRQSYLPWLGGKGIAVPGFQGWLHTFVDLYQKSIYKSSATSNWHQRGIFFHLFVYFPRWSNLFASLLR